MRYRYTVVLRRPGVPLQAELRGVDHAIACVQFRGRVIRRDRTSGGAVIDDLSRRYRGRPYDYPGGDAPKKRVTLHIAPERVQSWNVGRERRRAGPRSGA